MLILFINAHKKNQQGRIRFSNFYSSVKKVLKETIFFGTEVTETIRCFDELNDYIYDEITFRTQERARKRFQSLEYIFIDGNHNFAPWSEQLADVSLIIRKAIKAEKKIFCNSFGHFSAYFYLTAKLQKHCSIGISSESNKKQFQYQYQSDSGDLFSKAKKVCNSGIKQIQGSRSFTGKSSNAVQNGVVLSSKFQYIVFSSKSGSRLQRNINVPFTFYWKSKLFCTSKLISQVKAQIIYQTEEGNPLAFTFKQLLSTQALSTHFLKLLRNWLEDHLDRNIEDKPIQQSMSYKSIAFENKLQLHKTLTCSNSLFKHSRQYDQRPLSSKSKFSTLEFQKPAVRCSGKYETIDERYIYEQLSKKKLNLGQSRFTFKGKLQDCQIPNYVQRQPSRPASSHKFRDVQKDRWINKHDFYNC